ncbi:MAG: hypothetical protein EOO09_02350 [Chitinophagaceae bacterium]|nr:MAG: hypothetical protein EOO09_02350 [Chitinophagaceae bacterium]
MPHSKHISDELNELQSSLGTRDLPGTGFAVPQGYFDGFAAGMLARVLLLDELEGLSPLLANAPKSIPYSVPAGYFQSLDPMIPNRDEELSPLLSGLKTKKTFSLPEGYFDQLTREQQEEPARLVTMHGPEEELSPLLAGISRKMPNNIPSGYFDTLDPMVSVNGQPLVTSQTGGKLVRMGGFNWKRYVAAASVLLVVSLGTFLYTSREKSPVVDLATIPTEAIIDVVGDPAKQVISSVDKNDAAEISQLVKNVPAKDIQAFLNELGTEESDMDDDPLLN